MPACDVGGTHAGISTTPADMPALGVAGGAHIDLPDVGLGSGGAPPLPPLFAGSLSRSTHAVPVLGGTLLVTRDGHTIALVDPDRDAVFLVDSGSHGVRTVQLERDDEPGRVVEGADGTLFVALRRAGSLVRIDVASASVTARVATCSSPRGLGFDAKSGALYVACRTGELLTLDASSLVQTRELRLDTDLRDVVVRENELVLTRFLSSELLVVADDGHVARRATPSPLPGCAEATVAFRAFSVPGGQIALAHQASSDEGVSVNIGGYGFSCGGSLVTRFLTLVDPDAASSGVVPSMPVQSGSKLTDPTGDVVRSAMTFQSVSLPGAGPLDVAFSPRGDRVAVIAFDQTQVANQGPAMGDPASNLWVAPWDGKAPPPFLSGDPKSNGLVALHVDGQPVAVAFDAAGSFLVQSREPAQLAFEGGASVRLSDESHADSGHQMFHMNSGVGIACSSCHPEGGEDGHVWRFAEGLRRTLPLGGGVLERAPFHWDGTLADMGQLVNEVMLKRMNLPATPTPAQIETLAAFLEQLPKPGARSDLDVAAVARGQALFAREDVACGSCHSGAQYTDNRLVDVGTGGKFVTPTLLGVGLRTALFHDGCAKDVAARFGPCGGTEHGKGELLSPAERADLVAFMQSL